MGTFYIVSAIMMAFLTGLGAGFLVVLGMQKQLKKDFTTVLLVLFCLCGGLWSGKLAADGVQEYKNQIIKVQVEARLDMMERDSVYVQDSLYVKQMEEVRQAIQ
jgi:hypothetical protein